MPRGTFITFEGGEGSGKSTQARRLAERLRAAGLDVVETREPGGSPFAEVIRGVLLDPRTPPHAPLSEALLFYAARADHIAAVIRPALAAGRWVISDRFSDSTRVYQGHAGQLEIETISTLEGLVVGKMQADLTFIIDVPAEVGLKRAGIRRMAKAEASPDPDAYERRDLDFHRRLREGFLEIAAGDPKRCRVIDGEASHAEVEAQVWHAVAPLLKSKGR
ncbi:MAG: dTMP kinase [Hyphomicrobium sp.]